MKKTFGVLLLMLVCMVLLCLPAFAEGTDTAPETATGFYGIGSSTNVTITPQTAAGAAAESANAIIGEETLKLYKGAEKLDVVLANATNGGFYGVILVEGDSLPTKDNTIFYIDQVTAAENKAAFNVYPILPTENAEMSLYISSNVTGFELVKIPMGYAIDAELAAAPDVVYGELDGQPGITSNDALLVLKNAVGLETFTDDQKLAAEVDGDESGITSNDALTVLKYAVGLLSELPVQPE